MSFKYMDPHVVAVVKEHFNKVSLPKLAELSGVSECTVRRCAEYLGIEPDKEFMRSLFLSGQFKKGHTPANKGQKGVQYSPATQYKDGHAPHNTKHDGAVSMRRDRSGRYYLHIRVAKAKWIHLHRKIWEDANGPIPKGGLIRFIDGDTLNCAIENLMLVDRKQHRNMNCVMTDRRIAGFIGGKELRGDHEAINAIAENKELIALKRAQLKLKKELK